MRASLFITCYNDTLFPETGRAVVRLLERLGVEVEFRSGQTCCGQMHANTGFRSEAFSQAKRLVRLYADAEAVVIPSSSCVAMIRDQYSGLFDELGDDALSEKFAALAPRVYELSEFLVDKLGVEDVGAYFPHRVTYHASCHGLRALQLGDRPFRLLKKVRGLDFVPLENLDRCCGFGGTFSVKNADVSSAMLAVKLDDVLATGTEFCTALDNSCLMHLGGALHRQDAGMKTIHMAQILASTEEAPRGVDGMSAAAEHEVMAEHEVLVEHEVIDRPILDPALAPPFPVAALPVLRNTQLRKNVAHAIDVIQAKRARLVAEKPDWQELRSAASRIKDEALQNLGMYLEQFEARCTAAGGTVHWASDAADARRIILELLREEKANEVIKIKTMTSAEIQLNPFLEANGVRTYETDLAEIILQLGEGEPSHIVVPALHVNRSHVREIFARRMGIENLSDEPEALTAAARSYLRQKFLSVPTAISGANFLIAETGSVAVVESEGNGRMCLTLPRTMITLAGIEKVLPRFADLEVMLQLLARSATGERMNPYTSLWTGVTPGDGPQKFHVVLLDNGRSSILARKTERQTLRCIRCAACMNACPVYRQTGGHAYGSVYPGPIGAILTPQLEQLRHAQSLPYASSLCGACYEVCPVRINIPEVLLELRARITDQERKQVLRFFDPMYLGLRAANLIFSRAWLFHLAQRAGRIGLGFFTRKDGWIHSLPGIGAKWTQTRDLRGLPEQTFHDWWANRQRRKK